MRFVLLLAVLFAATPVSAQPGADRTRDRAQPAPQDRRDKIKQRIRALRAYTLTEQLELDEATAAKLFPALAKYDEDFDKLLLARTDLQRRLETAHDLEDAKAVDKLIDDAVANQKALWDTEDKRLSQLRKILTPAQTARLLVVLPTMERKIQNQLRRVVRKPAQRGAPGELGGNPYDRGSRDDPDALDPFDDSPPKRRAQPAPRKPRAGGDMVVDPFSRPRTDPPTRRAAPAKKPCDPFGDFHGCSP